MTPELQNRWKAGTSPFNGSTVAACDDPDLNTVLEILSHTCKLLRQVNLSISVFSDWHEHDGFIVNSQPSTWQEFLPRLLNTKSLYESRDSDDSVRVAIVPDSFAWLLRYNIEDSEDDYMKTWCEFDFTCTPEAPVYGLVHELHSKWPDYTDISAAKLFFDNSYGG